MYAVSGYADTGRDLDWDGVGHWTQTSDAGELSSLDWEALRALGADGWEIGSHTVTHPRLTRTTDDQLAWEMTTSREAVEAALGVPCASIAYPYGDVDERVVAAAADAGYTTAAALPAGWGQLGALEWPRVGVYHPDSLLRFRMKTARLGRKARGVLRR